MSHVKNLIFNLNRSNSLITNHSSECVSVCERERYSERGCVCVRERGRVREDVCVAHRGMPRYIVEESRHRIT